MWEGNWLWEGEYTSFCPAFVDAHVQFERRKLRRKPRVGIEIHLGEIVHRARGFLAVTLGSTVFLFPWLGRNGARCDCSSLVD